MAALNSVYLYRNGIADFKRVYTVKGKEKVSIPVKREQVGDLLASIDYFGPVRLIKPPSYTPVDTSSSLYIDPEDPISSALKAFSGARVFLTVVGDEQIEGDLVGVETIYESTCDLVNRPNKYVTVYTNEGFKQYNLTEEISAVQFITDSDRAEFQKALARNYQKIKPDSTFIDLILESNNDMEETEAVLQYALPVAAWNMSYRLKRDKADRWTLDGHAVVHNSTDFDWNGFSVSVVTGEPTTFMHDLAEAKMPARSMVNVTPERAYSNVSAEDGVVLGIAGACRPPTMGLDRLSLSSQRSFGAGCSSSMSLGGLESTNESFECDTLQEPLLQAASIDLADAATVGDYLVLTAKNLADIPANNSALVPMFSVDLPDAERVFYYKPSSNASFPFSSVRFKNTTDMPLTKGVVTVLIDGHNAGEAVLEDAKPGDTRLVSHTMESGIRVLKDSAKIDNPIALVRINEGLVYTETHRISIQEYTIKNKLDEEATLLIEHPWNIPQADVEVNFGAEVIGNVEKISTGVRFTVRVPAKSTSSLSVRENFLTKKSFVFDSRQFVWVSNQGWFDDDEGFKQIVSIKEEISRLEREVQEIQAERQKYCDKQVRANNFLSNVEGENRERWHVAINTAEDAIENIDTKRLPEAVKKQEEAQQRLQEAFKAIQAQWRPDQVGRVA